MMLLRPPVAATCVSRSSKRSRSAQSTSDDPKAASVHDTSLKRKSTRESTSADTSADVSDDEQTAMFSGTASRVYSL